MDEVEQAIVDLQAYKAMLVTARRRLVALGVHGNKNAPKIPGAACEMSVGPNTSKSADLRALQDDIDAVNRAIRDEREVRAQQDRRSRRLTCSPGASFATRVLCWAGRPLTSVEQRS